MAAPSKLTRPAGDRVKPDARDALHLARLLRLGVISPVAVPTASQEAARDLVRAREDARGDLMRDRHRVSKLLLRHGIVYSGGTTWTAMHERWLRTRRFDAPAVQLAFDSALEAMLLTADRRDRLDTEIERMAAASEFTDVVARLCCLRGVSTLTGFGLAVCRGRGLVAVHRLHDRVVPRAGPHRALLRGVPLPGLDHQDRQHPRPPAAREAAWHHQRDYRTPGAPMRARWDKAPAAARLRGHEGNQRLHDRWQTFHARKKRPVIANVAIARELAGWCWSLAMIE